MTTWRTSARIADVVIRRLSACRKILPDTAAELDEAIRGRVVTALAGQDLACEGDAADRIRMVQELRSSGLIVLRDRILTVHGPDALKGAAMFSPDYLHYVACQRPDPAQLKTIQAIGTCAGRRSLLIGPAMRRARGHRRDSLERRTGARWRGNLLSSRGGGKR